MNQLKKLHQIPMLKQIAEDTYGLSVQFPFGMRQVNSYLFEGENGVTIVDTGSCAPETVALWEQVVGMGITVDKLILTHIHSDHIGLTRWFQNHHKVPGLYIKNRI